MASQMPRQRSLAALFLMAGGLIAWSAQFAIVYGATSVVCERGLADRTLFGVGLVPAIIGATTLLALVAGGVVLACGLAARRRALAEGGRPPTAEPTLVGAGDIPTDRFLADATALVGLFSLAAILWTGLPALIVPPCW